MMHTSQYSFLNMQGQWQPLRIALLLVSCILFPATAWPAGSADGSPGPEDKIHISTPAGEILGLRESGVEVFRGVPYAAPPTGMLRWAEPREHPGWESPMEAYEFGPACPQRFNLLFADAGEQSEDCLYLNIWTVDSSAARRPVLVYVHGGAFQYGSGSQRIYDGSYLASRGVVVVTFNYRLGLLGFLAHPQLSAEGNEGSSGNYGLLDQLAVLQWVLDGATSGQAPLEEFEPEQRAELTRLTMAEAAQRTLEVMDAVIAKAEDRA